jgi:pyrimidine deaminase RibD-like protein
MARKADVRFMKMAIKLARQSKSNSITDPYVGAVITKGGKLLGTGYRGEKKDGDHAELTALDKCDAKGTPPHGATVYTTLEPCTTRNRPEIPCVERIIAAGVTRVLIGMLDPNQNICGKGVRRLRKAGIAVEFFPKELMKQVEALNAAFTLEQEKQEARLIPCGLAQRNSPYHFLQFADHDTEELYLVAQNLRTRLDDDAFLLRLEELLAGGTKVTLVLTTWEAIKAIQVPQGVTDFKKSVKELHEFYYKLDSERQKRLTVRFHKAAASLSVLVRDPAKESGRALMIFNPKWATDTEPEKRPYFALNRREHKELFDKLFADIPLMTQAG